MRHENFAVELCLLDEIRQASAMIDMKVCDEEKLNLLRVNSIEIWQLLDTFTTRVEAAVEHDFPALALEVDATATDLAP